MSVEMLVNTEPNQISSPFLQRRMGVLVNVLKTSVGYEAAQITVFFVIICCVCAFGFGFVVYRDAVTKQYKIVSSGGEILGTLMMVIAGVLLAIVLIMEIVGFLLNKA